MDWEPQDLLQLRKVLQVHDPVEVESVLIKYTEMFALFASQFQHWPISKRVDWSIAVAMAPDWFGESLSTRINNSMLVSALLITVTTAILLAPPQYGVPFDNITDKADNTRVFFYFCSVVNLMFIASIVRFDSNCLISTSSYFSSGVAFVENAMSRAYTQADKMILIARHYYVLNISQTLSMTGAFSFVFVVVIPTFKLFTETDALIMTLITIAFSLVIGYMFVAINMSASVLQLSKTNQFIRLIDSNTGRLLHKFYPNPASDTTSEYFDSMFLPDQATVGTKIADYVRT